MSKSLLLHVPLVVSLCKKIQTVRELTSDLPILLDSTFLATNRFRDDRIHELESTIRDLQQKLATLESLHGEQARSTADSRTETAVLRSKLEDLEHFKNDLAQTKVENQRLVQVLEDTRRALEKSESNATEAVIKHAEELGGLRQAVQSSQSETATLRATLADTHAAREAERASWKEERMRREETEKTLRAILDEHIRNGSASSIALREALGPQDLIKMADPRKTQAVCEALALRVAELEGQLAGPAAPEAEIPQHPSDRSCSQAAPSSFYAGHPRTPSQQPSHVSAATAAASMNRSVAPHTASLATAAASLSHSAARIADGPSGRLSSEACPSASDLAPVRSALHVPTTLHLPGARPPSRSHDSALELAEDLNLSAVPGRSRQISGSANGTRGEPSMMMGGGGLERIPEPSSQGPLHRSQLSNRPRTAAVSGKGARGSGAAAAGAGPSRAVIRSAVMEALQIHQRQGGALSEHIERLATARARYQGCFCKSENTFGARYPLDDKGRPTSSKGRVAHQTAGDRPRSTSNRRGVSGCGCPCGGRAAVPVDAAAYMSEVLGALEAEYAEAHQSYQDLVTRVRRTGLTGDEQLSEDQLHQSLRAAVEQVELKGAQLATLKKAIGSLG